MNPRRSKGVFTYLLVVLIAIFCIYFVSTRLNESTEKTDYTTIIGYFDDYKVSYYELDLGTGELKYQLRGEEVKKRYSVPNVSIFLDDTENYRIEYNKKHPDEPLQQNYIKITDRTWLYSLIPVLLTIALGIAILYFMMKQSGGGGKYTSFGKANLKSSASARKATFKDVAGADEEKQELEEIVDFLKNPNKYKEIGAKVPKGVLLLGPPGTGKTLLARAVAGEAGVKFFYISGSDFVEMLVGVGASRVRSLFAEAKKEAPSVVFIDEIDAVGRKRGAGLGGGQDEREQTLNQILVEMDGFSANSNVIVIAATNRVDVLDPALLRPGRCDRRIMVNMPDADGREAILKIHARNKVLAEDVDLREIALSTVGFTGADLENLLNEAALLAARKNLKKITMAEITDATFRVQMGPEKKSKKLTDKVKKLTAYHEAGHAIVLKATSDFQKVDRVTIIPAGGAGGYTAYKPIEDTDFYTEKMLLDIIKMSLGGRAAEEIFLGEVSTGAASDLKQCNSIARNMITRYGLSEKFRNLVFGDDNEEVFLGYSFGQVQSYSDSTAAAIDAEIKSIIDKCYAETKRILEEKRSTVEGLAKRLIEKNTVNGPEFEKIYEANGDLTEIEAEDEAKRIAAEANVNKEEPEASEAEETKEESSSVEAPVEIPKD